MKIKTTRRAWCGHNALAERLKSVMVLIVLLAAAIVLIAPSGASGQKRDGNAQSNTSDRTYPKEIRGYKLERAKVEIRKDRGQRSEANSSTAPDEPDALIKFGDPGISRMTPLGITLEVPVTVAAVKQKGRVDFLTFEDMIVNGIPVTIEEYTHPFDLPTDKPTLLPKSVRLFISTPSALMGALGEWNDQKQTWPVTGRVYVFGRFKKFLFKFKRVVPVELTLSLLNPLLKKSEPKSETKDEN